MIFRKYIVFLCSAVLIVGSILGIYFRGFIQFKIDSIFCSPVKNIETYFNLYDVEQTNILNYNFKSGGLSGYVMEAKLEINKEDFESVFRYYKNIEHDRVYENIVLFIDSTIKVDEFDYYMWLPTTVKLGTTRTQQNINIIKSAYQNDNCIVFLSIDKVGWIKT